MNDTPDNLVLTLLRELRAMVERQGEETAEVKRRLHSIDAKIAGIRSDMLNLAGDVLGINQQLDRVNSRLDRIERRLGLVEAT